MSDPGRLEFDSTLDEVADVNLRYLRQSETYRRQRRRSQWIVGGCLAVAMAVINIDNMSDSSDDVFLILVATVLVIALAFGVLFAYGYGHFHDWYARGNVRRMIQEMYRGKGTDTVRCKYEIRADALWTTTRDVEVSLPWRDLKRVSDTPGAIELWFDPGLAVVRDRAFANDEERQRFLGATRRLMARDSAASDR